MSELTAKHLVSQRREEGARRQPHLRARRRSSPTSSTARPSVYDDLFDRMGEADIVISSTAATHYVVTKDERRRRPQGPQRRARSSSSTSRVPRDIDPAVNDLADVYLYDIDDLNGVVSQSNLEERMREAERAEVIIDEEMAAFERWLESHGGRARRSPRSAPRPRRSARPSSSGRSSASAGCPRRSSQTVEALTECDRQQDAARPDRAAARTSPPRRTATRTSRLRATSTAWTSEAAQGARAGCCGRCSAGRREGLGEEERDGRFSWRLAATSSSSGPGAASSPCGNRSTSRGWWKRSPAFLLSSRSSRRPATRSSTCRWPRWAARACSPRSSRSSCSPGTVDLCVHSMKDVPTELPEGLVHRGDAAARRPA